MFVFLRGCFLSLIHTILMQFGYIHNHVIASAAAENLLVEVGVQSERIGQLVFICCATLVCVFDLLDTHHKLV